MATTTAGRVVPQAGAVARDGQPHQLDIQLDMPLNDPDQAL
jgi:hypothetical protein